MQEVLLYLLSLYETFRFCIVKSVKADTVQHCQRIGKLRKKYSCVCTRCDRLLTYQANGRLETQKLLAMDYPMENRGNSLVVITSVFETMF